MIFLKRYKTYVYCRWNNARNNLTMIFNSLIYGIVIHKFDPLDIIYRRAICNIEHCYYPRFYINRPPSIVYTITKHRDNTYNKPIVRIFERDAYPCEVYEGTMRVIELEYRQKNNPYIATIKNPKTCLCNICYKSK